MNKYESLTRSQRRLVKKMDNRKFGKLVKKSMRPPFNELAQADMSEEAKAVMEYAMQRSCDEQVKSLVDWEADIGYERGKCNKTPEEERKIVDDTVKLIKEQYGDVLRRLSKT